MTPIMAFHQGRAPMIMHVRWRWLDYLSSNLLELTTWCSMSHVRSGLGPS
jgi:hypothetical protein